jgi:hypothetical protein
MIHPQFVCEISYLFSLYLTILLCSKASTSNVKYRFLAAKLMMDSLATQTSIRNLRHAITSLPKDLMDVYEKVMNRIQSQPSVDYILAIRVLSWISYAIRPLTVEELQQAIAIEPGDREFDEDALIAEDSLLGVCAGLATIDHESNTVRIC